jgi:parallel beta-helix repeat protein
VSKVKKKRASSILLMILCSLIVTFPEMRIAKAEPKMVVVPDDYSTIQDAVDNAAEGDTVFVRRGYYFESVLIDKSLSLVAEPNETFIVGNDYKLNGTIVLIRHDHVNVSGFTIRTNKPTSSRRGIHLLDVSYCNVSRNTITDCSTGIWLYGASQNSIAGNNLIDNTHGIIINLSDDNTFVGNVAAEGVYGIQLIASTRNMFRSNNMTNNTLNFELSSGAGAVYFNDVDASNMIDGKPVCYWVNRSYETVPSDVEYVILVNCTGITVHDGDVGKSFKEILLVYTNNSNIRNTNVPIRLVCSSYNTIAHNAGTVQLENSSSNTITENTIKYANRMIYLTGSSGNIVSGNTVTNGNGILIYYSSNDNIISNNTLTNNDQGIQIHGSSRNILRNNRMTNNEKQFFVSSPDSALSNFVNQVDTSNTVNGKPIYYWINKKGSTVPSDAGCVVLVNCTGMSVENLNFTDGQSILLAWTTNSNIINNTVTDGQGIHLIYSSNGNTVSENIVGSRKYGVSVRYSFDNFIVGNNMTNCSVSGVHLSEAENIAVIGNTIKSNKQYGIALMENASKNTVSENYIEYNKIGIFVQDSSENLIAGNMIIRNDEWGIQLEGGQQGNIIYYNSFIDNRRWKTGLQVSIPGVNVSGVWGDGNPNVWDDGKKGNYWSDYTTRYQNATEIDGTGIGDTPFHINPNNIDNHPVIEANLIPEFPSWMQIFFMLSTVAVAVVIYNRKLSKTPAN